jgi:membrane-bound lytic murein transglycosylase D
MMSAKRKHIYACLILCLSAFTGLYAQHDLSIEQVEDSLMNQSPLATPDMTDMAVLDSMLMAQIEREYLNLPIDSIRMTRAELQAIPDSIFITRLSALDGMSPFRLDYNRHVHSSILTYLGNNLEGTALCLGRSELYFPMFEEILDREGLPLELKYLAIVESALRPSARSRAGATGLWQFMYGTGKECGLRIDSYVDERKSPIASTEAACFYLKKLYRMYGDWNLALAAYNSGPGNVNKAIRRAGGKSDYWAIWSYLPRETRGYVPAFIAVNYVMNFYEDHGILPIEPERRFAECDTLMVKGPIDFSQISTYTGVSMDDLHALNPHYSKGHIPNSGVEEILTLPRAEIGAYLMNSSKIRTYKAPVIPAAAAPVTTASEPSSPYSTEGKDKYTYTVRSGDVLGVIASRNGVSISKLRYWNNINGSRIYPGQKLIIYKEEGSPAIASNTAPSSTKTPKEEGTRYHTIRSGDTLWDIAKMYNGVSVEQIKKWNAHLDFKRLKPGQKVRVS